MSSLALCFLWGEAGLNCGGGVTIFRTYVGFLLCLLVSESEIDDEVANPTVAASAIYAKDNGRWI
jgi:hypothetical protein